ncbi:hypothetical protein [Deinococcus sp. 23YEL01]|uniref:hypothetical protein n=1 Tax=Deinococcus sp. 23YEL01 TaxID=2745871 RepID=UPI001E4DE882|nr:hypothetical protein [Deinococcus sp. 23YEL01]MCD0169441.1 hypothetical protein [Deinococcus sp. 23YEL01]
MDPSPAKWKTPRPHRHAAPTRPASRNRRAPTQGSDAVARIFAALYFVCLYLSAAPSPDAYRFAAPGILCGFLALAFALRRLTKEDVTA